MSRAMNPGAGASPETGGNGGAGRNAVAAPKLPLVCCVLVNWNGWVDTVACLESLRLQDYPALRVLVVDNGSSNDSVAQMRAAAPWATVIEAGENLGFACGTNVGLRRGYADGADYLWLLNNDTVAPPDTCSKLVRKAQEHPEAGLVGSVLYYMHDPSQVQAWGGGQLSVELGRSRHFHGPTALTERSYLTFASVLVPRRVLEEVGVLYEGYFMYWDDGDYALRVTGAGFGLVVAEDTAVLHKEGGSAAPRSPKIDRFSVTAGLHFLHRHARVPRLSMAIFLFNRFVSRVVKLRFRNAWAVVEGVRVYRQERTRSYSERL